MGTLKTIIIIMISAGSLIMVGDVVRFWVFRRKSNNVLTNTRTVQILKDIAFLLLVFFLFGYIMIGLSGKADIITAGVLFGGAIFVALVLHLLFRLVDAAQENSISISQMLIRMVELRDPNLNGHSLHVQNLVNLIYEYLPKEYKVNINRISLSYAALVHDIGKIGVPESVLNKPDKLDAEEWVLMKNHPAYGAEILSRIQSFKPITDWVKYHHERIDGKGYYNIPGKDIPLASRIIAVADTYSAISMKRTYKDARPYEDAIAILKEVRGTQLDADIVDIFVSIPKDEVLACRPETEEFIPKGEQVSR